MDDFHILSHIIQFPHIVYSLFQVLLKSSDYATFALYAMSCLVMMVLALLLPIETKGRSMKVRSHQLSSSKVVKWIVCNPLVHAQAFLFLLLALWALRFTSYE